MTTNVLDKIKGTKWVNANPKEPRGWNMIALPLAKANGGDGVKYRLLLNRFNETLTFTDVALHDKGSVPNRGFTDDQSVEAVQYIQDISQTHSEDRVVDVHGPSNIGGNGAKAIHHEPGFFVFMDDQFGVTPAGQQIQYARLGTIPHGDAVAALGFSLPVTDSPISIDPKVIGDFQPLPHTTQSPIPLASSYLEPYAFFHTNPFDDIFDPTNPLEVLLQPATVFKSFDVLTIDTTLADPSFALPGGITNLPFIVKHANATDLRFVLWLEELQDGTRQLQYAQRVTLDFFGIQWPHISVNTLVEAKQ